MLFAAFDVVGQAFNPGQAQLVFTDIANGSTNGSGASPTQAVTFRNTTGAAVAITGATIIDDPAVDGDHAGQFEAGAFPAFPVSVPAGGSASLNVAFRASSTGVKSAVLRVQTNDASQPTVDVPLRGIGTGSLSSGDVGGNTEPSLQRILNAFRVPVNVGDANGEATFDLPTPRPNGTQHDEVDMQRLRKAGSGPVVIQSLAEYAFNTQTGPVGHFGYYTPGTTANKTELFAVNVSERTSTNPTWGSTFDPGNADFALYGDFNGGLFEINGLPRGVYSEDKFNTWDANNKKKVRFFPLKGTNGAVVPNAFIFAFEEFNSGYDSNDVIGIIRNVQAAPAGPEVGTESLDRNLPSPTRLAFNRIQQQPPDPRKEDDGTFTELPNNVVHDKATLRVHNSGSAPLTISSAVLSNTTDFQINTTGLNGLTIQPGGQQDIEVQFKATSGRVKTGTLTLNTNDPDEPTITVNLAGYWQNKSENNEEATLQELVQLYGFGTKITNEGQQLNIPGQDGKVQAVGDEVLSPYWRRADAARAVEIVQLNAFHTHNEEESLRWHFRNSSTTTTLFTHNALDSQSLFPRLKGSTEIASGALKPAAQGGDTNPAFGFRIQNEWSDPTRNVQEQAGGGFGHRVRFWALKDEAGRVVPNAYLMAMDYQGVNYDYQDNVFVLRNMTPADAVGSVPAAPAGLAATASTGGIGLNWGDNAETDLAGYNVYRGTAADFTPGASNKLNGSLLSLSEFNDANAPAGAISYYKVTAVDTAGNESPPALANATRPPVELGIPSTPTGLAASAASPTSINVSWFGSGGADRYVLERRTAGGAVFGVVADNLTALNFTDTGLSPNTTYEYRISAANAQGTSAPSAVAFAKTPVEGNPGGPGDVNVSVADVSVNEPAAGMTNARFTITLDAAPASAVVVSFVTGDLTATAGSADYTATGGTVTFAAGETSKTVDVPVLADTTAETNETFVLNVNVSSGPAAIADGQAVATVVDPTAPPSTTIPFGGRTVATFTGPDGRPVRVSLKGPGTGEVTLLDGGGASIATSGTTPASSLTVTGVATLTGVTVNGSLRGLTGKTADLAGPLMVNGSLSKLLLRNASGAPSISVGNAGTLSATLASASDLNVTSGSPIRSLKVARWLDTGGPGEVLTAPSVASLSVRGDFAADLNVGDLGKLTVGGTMTGSDVRATGNIGTVRASAMRDSRVFAGVRSDLATLPDSADDFAAPATVRSVTVSGRAAGSFGNTLIAATTIGKASLGAVATANNGTPFGVAGDTIASVRAAGPGGNRIALRALDEPGESTTEGDFVLRVL